MCILPRLVTARKKNCAKPIQKHEQNPYKSQCKNLWKTAKRKQNYIREVTSTCK